MFVPFNTISNYGKIWVFPASRKFYPQEIEELKNKIESFLNSWFDKIGLIDCSFLLRYDRFLIIAVETGENHLILDSHDALTAFILSLEKHYDISLLDKMNVCYKQGKYVQYKDLKEFKKLVKNRAVSKKTIVLNNFINSKEELSYDWEVPMADSWLNNLLPK